MSFDLAAVAIALLLVAINAFFVASEFAIVRVRATRIEALVAEGSARARVTRDVLRHLDAYISACQVGITITSLGLGWVGEPAFAHLLEPWFGWAGRLREGAAHTVALALSFALITFLHVVLGELVPKTVAITQAERTALWVSWPLRIVRFLFYPAIWIMNGAANLAIRAVGLPPASEESLAHSEAELRMILAVSEKSGVLSEPHARLLEKALDFADRTVRQVLVPRGDIVWLDLERPPVENGITARESGHTRYPLCSNGIDHVVGILHIKDVFHAPHPSWAAADLRALARPPLFVPESASLEQALALFQKQRNHLAIVVDEYGGTAGVVTLEDVLEELIGEIQDEFDQESPKVQTLPDGRILADASLPIAGIEDYVGPLDVDDPEVDTLGGLVLSRLGRLAHVGDRVSLGRRAAEVVRVRGRRILRVRLDPAPPSDPVLD